MNNIDNKYLNDLSFLVEHFILVANSLKGKAMPKSQRIRFAEPLIKKALNHIISAIQLNKGTKFVLSDNSYVETIDFSSIAVVTRAAVETYLTFNYVLVNPKDKQEQDFRFLCWDLAGFIEREKFPGKTSIAIKIKEDEQVLKKEVISQLENISIFQNLGKEEKKNLLRGNWRINKSWTDLAEAASIPDKTFKHIYSYLCSYSHSGRLSIIQIEQSKDVETQKKLSQTFLSINLIILARIILEYVDLIPECKNVFESNPQAVFLTNVWNETGNNIKL